MSSVAIDAQQLGDLVESISAAMLGLPLSPDPTPCGTYGELTIAASIDIRGAFCGSVLFLTTEPFARRAAAAMLAAAEGSLARSDVEDAMVELCNILGGGVKGLVPGPSFLSLPSIILNVSPATRLLHAPVMASIRLVCEGEPLEVRVIEQCGDSKISEDLPSLNGVSTAIV